MSAQSGWRRQSSQANSGQRGSHSQAHSRDRSAGGSGGSTPTSSKQESGRQGPSSYAGNAWGGDKGKAEGQRQQGGQRAGPSAAPAQPPQEVHTPVRGFNSKETKDFLKSRYQASTTGPDGKPTLYKAQGDLAQRNSGPWGSKPNTMANGQDFWVQLRKQVNNLESAKAS